MRPRNVPDPENGTAHDIASQEGDPEEERVAREQARQILEESEARTEDNATVDPDDDTIERRQSDETA